MMKFIAYTTLTMAFLATGCSTKMIAAKDGQSITSSIAGNEKDVKELQQSFKDLSAKLLCTGMAAIQSATPKFNSNSVDLTFKTTGSLEGKACSVEINGTPNADKKVEWTSSEGTVGLLYVSTEATVASGKLNLNFYKTFQLLDPNAKMGQVTVHATFPKEIFGVDATEVKAQSAELKCDDASTIAADLSKAIIFKKDAANLKADLIFKSVPVKAYKNCIASAIFDPSKVDVVSGEGAVTVEADKTVEVARSFTKRPPNADEVNVDGTLGGQQRDQLLSKDMKATAEAKIVVVDAKDKIDVQAKIEGAKAGTCDLKVIRIAADKTEAASALDKLELKDKGSVSRAVQLDVNMSEGKPAVKIAVVAKCAADKSWTRLVEKDIAPKAAEDSSDEVVGD